ncbi:MAG: secretin N-terminal domain-containing protein [Pseudomonadota bacterium]
MTINVWRLTLLTLACGLVTACAAPNKVTRDLIPSTAALERQPDVPAQPTRPATELSRSLEAMPVFTRLAWPEVGNVVPDQANEQLYSFVAENLPIQQALQIFARAYGINIVVDHDVQGVLTAEFTDLPFDQAMEAMLKAEGLYWERDGNLVAVKSWETRSFTVNYIRLVRSGESSSVAQISTGSGGGEDEGGDGGGAGEISVSQSDSVAFWDELESQLEDIASENGRILINRMAGTVQISDVHPRVEEVARYIEHINSAVHRQVDIDVKIVEVALNDDFSLGVDWSQLKSGGADGTSIELGISQIIGQPVGGAAAGAPTLGLRLFGDDGDLDYSVLVEALQEQGEVRTVSQPKIRTLNNQSAMIKVGTDRTFFSREVTTDTTSGTAVTVVEDVAQIVTEGIVLSITPQISTEGWIMLDVSPVITRVASVSEVRDENGNVRSNAPNLEIRQASSLVRARNGETVVIGGLIQEQETDTERSVPVLGNLPVVGGLFRGTYQSKTKKELLMFITARLVETPFTTAAR